MSVDCGRLLRYTRSMLSANLINFNINFDTNRQCRVIQLNVKGKPTHTVAEIIIWFPAEFVCSFTKK